uniref:RNA-dependent RNA polymerase n=1 Tax=Tasmanian devil-associated rotavirus 2 TaxID=2529471 RepID=A0A481W6A1_9REOV|nr:MAG: RNA-dependent RNA polymerase [Tasmanian devil-associated rotavirus 2]
MINGLRENIKQNAAIIEKILIDKEQQKTLGVPSVQTEKNYSQNTKAIKALSVPSVAIISNYYPEDLWAHVMKYASVTIIDFLPTYQIYYSAEVYVNQLRFQLGTRTTGSHMPSKPTNTLYNIVSKNIPFQISPNDIYVHSLKYKLNNPKEKRKFLYDLSIKGNEAKHYLATSLLNHDLLLCKYDKLWQSPGFGAAQLNTVQLDQISALKVFNFQANIPAQYMNITLLILLYEYVHEISSGQPLRKFNIIIPNSETSKFTSELLHIVDNIQLDNPSYTDQIW